MQKSGLWLCVCLVAVLLTLPGRAEDKKRNPFDLPDVKDPYGDDVKKFAAGVKLPGGEKDENAEQWVKNETEGKADVLDGEWTGRWSGGKGSTKIKVIKKRVYILYSENDGSGTQYLLEAELEGKDRLVGRWHTVGQEDASGFFVGLIVNNERIDGTWGENARWDFRRKLKK